MRQPSKMGEGDNIEGWGELGAYVKTILSVNARTAGCEWGSGSGDLVPAAEVAVELEISVCFGVCALPVIRESVSKFKMFAPSRGDWMNGIR